MSQQQEPGNRIRLLLVSDHPVLRAGLGCFLTSTAGFAVAECATVEEAMGALGGSPMELVLLDLDLGWESAGRFIAAARAAGYRAAVLVLAAAAEARTAAALLRSGAAGIFLKSETPERLILAIRLVAAGEAWLDPKVIQTLADEIEQLPQEGAAPDLKEPEREVLLGIVAGLTNKRIGENLGLSESSVKNIIQRLFRKAGVKKRDQLVRVALESSLGASPP